MTKLFADADAVASATRPAPGAEHTVTATTTALLDAAAATGTRIVFIGGSAPLQAPGDGLTFDHREYVPRAVRAIAAASIAQLDACRQHAADWTYVSTPALLEPAPAAAPCAGRPLAAAARRPPRRAGPVPDRRVDRQQAVVGGEHRRRWFDL